ncbi:uncharacterized protein LOC122078960 isoform X2 [Macadamia integrifolia]|uniref:uncharacterized protein LOC122078960 isoform X2 n=1 Tax=Macadamia integrifolia TaxID=60698 RepID=UPI001C4F1C55|nr:uncharacterized protein LOC122078960 isoform X2 [Macadamia integrifolia]
MFLRRATRFFRSFRFPSRTNATTCRRTSVFSSITHSSIRSSYKYGAGVSSCEHNHWDHSLWLIISGQAAIVMGINGNLALAEDVSVDPGNGNIPGEADSNSTVLHRIEDGSVVSNIHTSKWRVYTDNARDLFLQGKLDEAERYFKLALQEAKQGFGDRDPHVASACNNLAELYRVKKLFDKAEPLYLEAIKILEESFGPEDIRVGAALHNLGQFYLVQRKLEEARMCYERALKVLYLQGKEKDAEALIKDSIRILEEAGLGESAICLRRLRHLAQMFLKSNRLEEAEHVQRKILHIMELSKGWDSLDTVIAAESLALTLQSIGKLTEAQELLERCLDVRKTILPEDHIQIGANMLHLARVAMLKSNRLRKVDIDKAKAELDKAKVLLENSIRIAQRVLNSPKQKGGNTQNTGQSRANGKDEQTAMVILLQSLDALGLLEITKQELQESMDECSPTGAENALERCISAFKEYGTKNPVAVTTEAKAEYLSCLKHFLSLKTVSESDSSQHSEKELKDEIKRVEAELFSNRKRTK